MDHRTVAVLGFGEVGQVFARRFSAAGTLALVAYDPKPSPAALSCIDEIGAEHADTLAECAEKADLVLSCVPGDSSLEVAAGMCGAIRSAALYADFATASPEAMREADALLTRAGALFVDAAIMGSVSISGHRAPIMAAGKAADALAAFFTSHGFDIAVLPNARPGDASGLKLLRSVFTKGLEALAVESLLAARRYGLEHQFLAALRDLDQTPIAELLEILVCSHVVHAVRRGNEVERACAQLKAAGVPPVITSAVLDQFVRTRRALENGAPSGTDMSSALRWLDDRGRL